MDTTKNLLWSDHYQGAVYPLDFTVDPDALHVQKLGQASCIGSNSKRIPSLVHISCNYIVRDATMTQQAVNVVPVTLYLPLIQEALLSNRDRALKVLVNHWPTETLSLKKLLPSIFASVLPLYNYEYLSDIVRRGVMCTTNVAHAVIQRLQEKTSKSNLKHLDMTGYPTAEVMLQYLASNCMLAHSEQAMVERINKMNECNATYELQNFSYVLPQDSCLLIKLDAFVSSWSSYSGLCKALKVSTFENRNLRLCIQRLGATCLGQAAIEFLLMQLDSEHLIGLQLKYNSLNRDDFVKLAPVLKTLTNLTALDLSCNSIYFWDSDATCLATAGIFSSLCNLIRLDLSNNRIKTKLRRVLADIPQPLQYLRLVGCSLTVTDITYLSLSHHTAGLEELDLSENNLAPTIHDLCRLFIACAPRLKILELQEVYLYNSHVPLLQHCFFKLNSLLYLNFADNVLSWYEVKTLTRLVSGLQRLQVLKFPFPLDLYKADEDDIEMQKNIFGNRLSRIVVEETVRVLKAKPIHLVLCELEVTINPLNV